MGVGLDHFCDLTLAKRNPLRLGSLSEAILFAVVFVGAFGSQGYICGLRKRLT